MDLNASLQEFSERSARKSGPKHAIIPAKKYEYRTFWQRHVLQWKRDLQALDERQQADGRHIVAFQDLGQQSVLYIRFVSQWPRVESRIKNKSMQTTGPYLLLLGPWAILIRHVQPFIGRGWNKWEYAGDCIHRGPDKAENAGTESQKRETARVLQ